MLLSLFMALGLLGMQAGLVFAAGSVSLGAVDVAYTQDFDGEDGALGFFGTSVTDLPNGWWIVESGTSFRAANDYAAFDFDIQDTTPDTYNFSTFWVDFTLENSLGTRRGTDLEPTFGASFANNTGATVGQLDVSYRGEQWIVGGSGAADRLDFQWSTDATSLTSGTWNDADSLDFASLNTGAFAVLDGNAAGNNAAISGTISVSIANGATFWIRWTDFDVAGADDGLSVDDFSLTPHAGGGTNQAPTFSVAGVSCDPTGLNGTFAVTATDGDGPQDLTFGLNADGNSNPSLVTEVSVTGTAGAWTVVVSTAYRTSGSATLEFTLSDGENDVPVVINVQSGTEFDDVLTGTEGPDLLVGGNGHDTLNGLGDGDVLCGGNGNDTLNGGDGADALDGDKGNDSLSGGAGNDGLVGGQGNDSLTGGADADAFSGGSGSDVEVDFNAGEGDTSDGS